MYFSRVLNVYDTLSIDVVKVAPLGKSTKFGRLDADIEIKLNSKLIELTKNIDFAELCITSKSSIKENIKDEVIVETKKAMGNKCPICWKITVDACERPQCPS